jgi:PIN domain nuclease of toxin-antitoxin system
MYVTDTHALIWYTQPKKSRLGKRATSLFEEAERERTLIYVPSVVLWELADQLREGTLRLRQRFDQWCRALDAKQGFQIQPLLWEDVNEARGLPFGDPFDCLIAGTALRLGVPLITKDSAISESGLVETVW